MSKSNILEAFAAKGADVGVIADRLAKNSKQIQTLIGALQVEKSPKKYAYEKALRLASERQPELIYPYFDFFCSLLDNDNNFLKWGAIMTVANLTAVDTQNKFEAIFKKYFAPINGPTMVTAANIIGSSVAVARAKPALTDAITREILKVEKARFELRAVRRPNAAMSPLGMRSIRWTSYTAKSEIKLKLLLLSDARSRTRENKSPEKPNNSC